MTQEEILEYNKRCAEFLGIKLEDTYPVNWKEFKHLFNSFEDSLKFHSDWNWIMEVIDNIEKLGFNFDSYNPTGIGKDGFYEFNIFEIKNIEIAGRGNTSKEAYIDAINRFLIWYNENNK